MEKQTQYMRIDDLTGDFSSFIFVKNCGEAIDMSLVWVKDGFLCIFMAATEKAVSFLLCIRKLGLNRPVGLVNPQSIETVLSGSIIPLWVQIITYFLNLDFSASLKHRKNQCPAKIHEQA